MSIKNPIPRPPGTESSDPLRRQARLAAKAWTVCSPPVPLLLDKWQKADASIRNALTNLRKHPESELPYDARWFVEHSTRIRAALQEIKEAVQSSVELFHVQTINQADCRIEHVPRAYAAADSFFHAVDYRPDMARFIVFLLGVQEELPFSCPELWMLRSLALLTVLDRIGRVARTLPDSKIAKYGKCVIWLTGLNWTEVFQQVSVTERILRCDPPGMYERMDCESREQYCREVVSLARHSPMTEQNVARSAVALALAAETASEHGRERRTHVGYYLLAEGNAALREAISYRPPLSRRIREKLLQFPSALYLGAIGIATLLTLTCAVTLAGDSVGLGSLIVFLLPALGCAIGVTNMLVSRTVGPRRLARLDFSKGIPKEYSAMVVVPTLLLNEKQTRQVVRELEIRFLGNRDANLHFALLTDPPDSIQQFDDKDALAPLCSRLVDELNQKYAGEHGSFFHFHRHRVYSETEEVWMAWERKRGKLRDFNVLLQGTEDRFPVKTGDFSVLPSIKYVITLDVDTQLPRDAARTLVAAIAHPLNRGIVDPATRIVSEGYGILQPRIEVSSRSVARSRLAAICSGDTGFDIYTRAVSDVYQDLFGEGIFTGKGIYEVAVLQQVLERRFPAGLILSHDHIEGAYTRAGLISDVEFIDDYPSHLSSFSRRLHRWVRGDWQTMRWLLPYVPDFDGRRTRNPLTLISRWRIFDNLRRSLTEFATLLLFVYGWLFSASPWRWTFAALAIGAFPSLSGFALSLFPVHRGIVSSQWWRGIAADFKKVLAQLTFHLTFLCHQGLVTMDAAVRALVRLYVTHKRLLEWETAAQSEHGTPKHPIEAYLDWTMLLSGSLAVCLAVFRPSSLLAALPLLALWSASKVLSSWLALPVPSGGRALSIREQLALRAAVLRTWRFFREFSNEKENYLVPDSIQDSPPLQAHRVSPTNLGLLLNSNLAAYDLGYWTLEELAQKSGQTLQTMQRMARYQGHFYNWYESITLEPIPPKFISTVDNGNLVCSLWASKQGYMDARREPLFRPALVHGIRDHLAILEEILAAKKPEGRFLSDIHRLKFKMNGFSRNLQAFFNALPKLESEATALTNGLPADASEAAWWARELLSRIVALKTMIADFAPWLLPEFQEHCTNTEFRRRLELQKLSLESAPSFYATLDGLIERIYDGAIDAHWRNLRAALLRSSRLAADLGAGLDVLVRTADELAREMNFRLFFNEKNKLLSIGYLVEEGRRHASHYDLLASEARTAAFVAVARGDIPIESWFAMGRPQTLWNKEPVLLSWTGTMFEYLMPSLWMQSYSGTLLCQSERTAVRMQQEFAAKNAILWGISESACGELNPDGYYRYRAFGVPGLAVNRNVPADLVVSPYSSFLALPNDAVAAAKNLDALSSLGLLGKYGFYDAVDFTASKADPGRKSRVARCWMAHHQGMILVAAANFFAQSAMQKRFHSEPLVVATERILQEKLPNRFSIQEEADDQTDAW